MRGELHARLAAAFGARVKAHGIIDIDDLAQVAIDTIREPTQATAHMGGLSTDELSTYAACELYRAMVDAER